MADIIKQFEIKYGERAAGLIIIAIVAYLIIAR
jgi:hypothetical protein